ncbi:MAG: peptidoglycan-binding protein [Verrucomicrobia bacterium]|nr:peptidoglycan-binding protein [Verrucomicrobiota bacterium]
MADAAPLVKAELRELDENFENEKNPERTAIVQFNPESLKVSFANQVKTPEGSGDQRGTPARQFVGAGTTKLALLVWFDVMALPDGENTENDVRNLTRKVSYFITPQETTDRPPKFVPPAVRFIWGSFQFDGIMESLEESLEYFSADGRPLRASMSFTLTQQKIKAFTVPASERGKRPPPATAAAGSAGADPSAAAGTKPLTAAPAGASLQGLAEGAGLGADWKQIASANGIENPRLLQPGQLIDLNVSTR